MSIFRFITQDKEAMSIWLGFFIVTALCSWVFCGAGVLVFVGTYVPSFMEYRKYNTIKNKLSSKQDKYEEYTLDIVVSEKDKKISGPIANRAITTAVQPYTIKTCGMRVHNTFVILMYKKELGFIRMYLPPFIITNSVQIEFEEENLQIFYNENFSFKENVIIEPFSEKYGIKRIEVVFPVSLEV